MEAKEDMPDPETDALLVLYDDAQSIYTKRVRRKFSFKSVGIEARGRTTILRLNYRNTAEVLGVACEFARGCSRPKPRRKTACRSSSRRAPAGAARRPSS